MYSKRRMLTSKIMAVVSYEIVLNEHRDVSEEGWRARSLKEMMSRNQLSRVVEGSFLLKNHGWSSV